ncbi:DM13 domain-containing protein [Nodosilinea sp. LEGE 06152]|uniref:DM13 domain-containing protein n=1 Tax=Nodosilinea sp. LEGE 06152 TaxID=2777966 RepID=UPI0018822EE4|nr:DM13 domain-containing protein [Nodosilinea sp. LEGE 06152]MBE9160581.1 DM13 domain-containing protein [Nodosilinea sp. LEGE 06152]
MQLKRFLLLGFSVVLLAACGPGQPEVAEDSSTAETAIATSEESTSTPEPEAATSAAEPSVIKSGSFVSGEHETSGGARIIDDGGQFVLELDETFQTSSMGPDLVVVLHRSDDVISSTEPPAFPLQESDYVVLAELESFSGIQRYAIPADINLDDYQSAAIWCRRFNATFGAATLQ